MRADHTAPAAVQAAADALQPTIGDQTSQHGAENAERLQVAGTKHTPV